MFGSIIHPFSLRFCFDDRRSRGFVSQCPKDRSDLSRQLGLDVLNSVSCLRESASCGQLPREDSSRNIFSGFGFFAPQHREYEDAACRDRSGRDTTPRSDLGGFEQFREPDPSRPGPHERDQRAPSTTSSEGLICTKIFQAFHRIAREGARGFQRSPCFNRREEQSLPCRDSSPVRVCSEERRCRESGPGLDSFGSGSRRLPLESERFLRFRNARGMCPPDDSGAAGFTTNRSDVG